MLVLLPPSEGKSPGGRGAPVCAGSLSFPSLDPVRTRLMHALRTLSSNVALARTVLKLSERQSGELAANQAILEAPTCPAIRRYNGVLYEALGYGSLPAAAQRWADRHLVVCSALFGALRPLDPIPAYRLSGGTTLPGVGSLRAVWRPALAPVLDGDLVLDLRSTAYRALAPVPAAIRVRVLTRRGDGSLTVVSHHNKDHKGRLVRALCTAAHPLRGPEDIVQAARRCGLQVSPVGPRELDLLA